MKKDDIRYTKVTDFLVLLHMMMSEPNGVSLEEICERFYVSRRTAERMRDAITAAFSQVDVVNDDEKIKRWGFINYSLKEIVTFTDKEIAAIEAVKHHFRNMELLPEINSVIEKMKILKAKTTQRN